MPTKQGDRALKNASTSGRCSFRRNTALPAASTPCSWKTRLAMSKPTVVISMVDGSFSSLHSTARAWHIDAVRGRPPHQILSTRLLSSHAWREKKDDRKQGEIRAHSSKSRRSNRCDHRGGDAATGSGCRVGRLGFGVGG